MKKFQNGIVVNKGAVGEKPAEKDNAAGTTVPEPQTTTVTAKAGAATVVTTTSGPTTPTATKPEEKKPEVTVHKDGGVTVTAGDGVAHGGDVIVTVNFGPVTTNA